jgi:hypothetical protein
VDVHLNTRAMGPALWYAYLTRDARLIKFTSAWADSWIRAMRETKHGKPAGIFPPVLRSADGSYLIGSQGWSKPEAEWDYFQWSGSSQEAITSLVLAVYDLTGDRKYLDAVTESFQPLANCGAHQEVCRDMVRSPEAFFAWRRLTGDARFDRAFGFRPSLPDSGMLRQMTRMANAADARFGVNWDIFTTEPLYTDRVYYPLPAEYRWYLFGGEAPRGDRYPSFPVTWPAAEFEFARAVLETSSERLRIQAYSFEEAGRSAPVRLWRLKPGRYSWTAGAATGDFTVERLPHHLEIPLPARKEVTIVIQAANRRARSGNQP